MSKAFDSIDHNGLRTKLHMLVLAWCSRLFPGFLGFLKEMSYVFSFTFFSLPLIFTLHWWPLAFLILSPPLQSFHVVLLKLINYSCTDDPISMHQLSQVHVFWYPMNIPIKTHSISSKTDQDTDQETWILISLNTKYSIFAASIIT